jgi:hypothetical protein
VRQVTEHEIPRQYSVLTGSPAHATSSFCRINRPHGKSEEKVADYREWTLETAQLRFSLRFD